MTTILPDPKDSAEQRRLSVIHYLQLTREQMESAKRNRVVYVKLAREYGFTNQSIGEYLDITESAVRAILTRDE